MTRSLAAKTNPSSALALDVGSVVDRRYRLKREIARGGAGAVFEAEHLYTTRPVAIKLLIAEQVETLESRQRLLLEARALSVARHPGIVQGLDAGETEDGTPYLVMELLEGRTLEGILAVRRCIGVADAVYIGLQLCDALAAAHERGILHRDIKPSNVFISRTEAGREVAKVFDFGIARFPEQDQKITQQGALLGTPEYMAPEQLLAREDVDARVDIYALGISLYEALAGTVPFEGNFGEVLLKVCTQPMPSLVARCPHVPIELERALEIALAREPGQRYASVRDFAEALSKVPTGNALPTSLLGLRAPPANAPSSGRDVGPRSMPGPNSMPSIVRRPTMLANPTSMGRLMAAAPTAIVDQPSTRRRFARAPYVTPTRIFRANGTVLEGRSEDISAGGLLVLAPQAFTDAEQVTVRFALPITGKLLTVSATARWVKSARNNQGAVGLEFKALAPDQLSVIENYVTAMGTE